MPKGKHRAPSQFWHLSAPHRSENTSVDKINDQVGPDHDKCVCQNLQQEDMFSQSTEQRLHRNYSELVGGLPESS